MTLGCERSRLWEEGSSAPLAPGASMGSSGDELTTCEIMTSAPSHTADLPASFPLPAAQISAWKRASGVGCWGWKWLSASNGSSKTVLCMENTAFVLKYCKAVRDFRRGVVLSFLGYCKEDGESTVFLGDKYCMLQNEKEFLMQNEETASKWCCRKEMFSGRLIMGLI